MFKVYIPDNFEVIANNIFIDDIDHEKSCILFFNNNTKMVTKCFENDIKNKDFDYTFYKIDDFIAILEQTQHKNNTIYNDKRLKYDLRSAISLLKSLNK